MTKTATQALHEVCAKAGAMPHFIFHQYHPLPNSSESQSYLARAKVFNFHGKDFDAVGSGPSKKAAKHGASRELLLNLAQLDPWILKLRLNEPLIPYMEMTDTVEAKPSELSKAEDPVDLVARLVETIKLDPVENKCTYTNRTVEEPVTQEELRTMTPKKKWLALAQREKVCGATKSTESELLPSTGNKRRQNMGPLMKKVQEGMRDKTALLSLWIASRGPGSTVQAFFQELLLEQEATYLTVHETINPRNEEKQTEAEAELEPTAYMDFSAVLAAHQATIGKNKGTNQENGAETNTVHKVVVEVQMKDGKMLPPMVGLGRTADKAFSEAALQFILHLCFDLEPEKGLNNYMSL